MESYQIVEWGKPLQLRLLKRPRPQGDQVLVKIAAAGVCHSDVHLRAGYFDLGEDRTKRPGRAPVCVSSRTMGTPDTMVAL